MTEKTTQTTMDVVISWVDGNEQAHRLKMQEYLDTVSQKSDDIAGPTRFGSVGEIYYCVASIFRFAPFVRKVFIITDNQNPGLDRFIALNFPESTIQIEIVDHTTVFRGFENYLPVFNSRAIETCTYRIPGLSENYVYLNDDFFLLRPVTYNDWFQNEHIIAYGHWRSVFLDRLLWLIKPMKNGHKPIGFKDGMLRAAKVLAENKRYFHLEHMPHPIKKSVLSAYFEQNPHIFEANIGHKFRNARQFNTQALHYLLMFREKRAIQKPSKHVFLYMKPVRRGPNYLKRKLNEFEKNKQIQFCCIGSLDMATEKDRLQLMNWLRMTINIVFP